MWRNTKQGELMESPVVGRTLNILNNVLRKDVNEKTKF